MKITIPEEVKRIFKTLEDAGHEAYLVGGAVRDIIMGRDVHDWDFTTNATPEEISKLFKDSFYNNNFGTVGVPAETEGFDPHEITTYRTESSYSDSRRPDKVEWGKSLEEDLQRRDFTVNAIALRQAQGKPSITIIDPHDGQKDIEKKEIKAVGDAVERFSEDALRMMRAVRIAAELGFTIERETFEAIKMHSSTINKIASERVRDELMKIMASSNPYEGIMMFKNAGLMLRVLPELEKTFGVEQKSPGRHHIYDVGTHCVLALKNCPSKDPIVRFAALIHDIGKPQTYKKLKNGTITFYNHEVVGSRIASRIAKRLKFSKKDKEKLFILVRHHQFTVDEHQTDKAIRRFIRNVGVENVQDMLDLRVGDRIGSGSRETSWRTEDFKKRIIEVQKQPFAIKDLKISGEDVMHELNIKPGPKVGQILKDLFEKVVEKEVKNERKTLLTEIISQQK